MSQLKPGDKVRLNDIEKARREIGLLSEIDFSASKNIDLTISERESSEFVEGKGFITLFRVTGGKIIDRNQECEISGLLIPATGLVKI